MLESNSIISDRVEDIDLLELGLILWKQRLLIFGITVFTTLSSMGISFFLPKVYLANATVLPTAAPDMGSSLAAGISAQLGAAAGFLGGVGSLSGGKSGDLVDILSSRAMAERVIAACDLERKLKGGTTHNGLVSQLMEMTTIVPPNIKNKVIEIKVEAPGPEQATIIANAYVSELKDMLDEIGYNSAAKNRKFISNQFATAKRELASAEDRLATFQAKNRLTSLPDSVVASIKSISDLEAQRIGVSVQLKSMDEAFGLIKSRVHALQADPNSLLDLEVKRKGLAVQEQALLKAQKAFLEELSALPPKGMQLARLQRDVQVQNAIYLAMSQQLEAAIINENKESDAFILLDRAIAPDHPVRPRKMLITLVGFLAGLSISSLFLLVKDRFSKLKGTLAV